ncbi:hypothetical protein MMC10_001047 [Thelotrema lepadinum]|nr:hypothetical protein [Thelotrema lepadinum]
MDPPRSDSQNCTGFLARAVSQDQPHSPLQTSQFLSRTVSQESSASQALQSTQEPTSQVSTENSIIFQRRQRRKLEKQQDTTQDASQDVGSHRFLPPTPAQQLNYSRKASDAYTWIKRFIPPGCKAPFHIFNILLDKPELLLEVTKWLEVDDLVALFAISKDFHSMMNTQMTTMIMGNARARAPESAEVFLFKCYQSLCIYDPAQNRNEVKPHMLRNVPSLRWLRFIHFREEIVDCIIRTLAAKGQRLPKYASKVIKKIWFVVDVPDNKRRMGILHNSRLWSDVELYIACMFFMKLDMACTDPVDGKGERGIRRLLLAQRSLSKTDEVLHREELRNPYELLQMHVEWKINRVNMPPGMHAARSLFNVPLEDCGRLGCEYWSPSFSKLRRPDELIMKESIRRGLNFKDKVIDLFLWGNLHPVTGEDVFPRNKRGDVQTSFDFETERQALEDLKIHASKEGTHFEWDTDEDEEDEDDAEDTEGVDDSAASL